MNVLVAYLLMKLLSYSRIVTRSRVQKDERARRKCLAGYGAREVELARFSIFKMLAKFSRHLIKSLETFQFAMSRRAQFLQKKQAILRQLANPDTDYNDLSPKGSVDTEISEFVDEINGYEGLVTTSSCSGRISVFLEGQKAGTKSDGATEPEDGVGRAREPDDEDNAEETGAEDSLTYASNGGKGGGGRWLFVSHQPVLTSQSSYTEVFGLEKSSMIQLKRHAEQRFVHLKFEPMILHILAESLPEAQKVLSAAQQAGFRESGIGSVQGQDGVVMVAVRTMGLSFDNIVGVLDGDARMESGIDTIPRLLVDEDYLRLLVNLSNEKFKVNADRTQKFRALLAAKYVAKIDEEWEDATVRRERKRAEGLRRKAALAQRAQDDAREEENGALQNEVLVEQQQSAT